MTLADVHQTKKAPALAIWYVKQDSHDSFFSPNTHIALMKKRNIVHNSPVIKVAQITGIESMPTKI